MKMSSLVLCTFYFHPAPLYEHEQNKQNIQTMEIICYFLYMVIILQVEEMCNLRNILLRTGCFCNTGACQMYLQMSTTDIINNFKVISIFTYKFLCTSWLPTLHYMSTFHIFFIRLSLGRLNFVQYYSFCKSKEEGEKLRWTSSLSSSLPRQTMFRCVWWNWMKLNPVLYKHAPC